MGGLRFGIIGAGGIAAKLHLPEIAALAGRAEVTLISGRKQSRLNVLRERFGVRRTTTNYDDVIADDDVDAVIVATPHGEHVSWAIKALAAGKHVMVQKPLCGARAEADAMVAAAAGSDRTALILPHFAPPIYDFRRRMAAGEIGRVGNLRARTAHGGPDVYYREVARIFGEPEPRELWFFDAAQASVGALFDMGVYAVAQIVALGGTVRRVAALTTTFDKPTQLEDSAMLLLQLASGALATAETSWCDAARTWELSVHGTAGKLVLPDRGAPPLRHIPLADDSDRAEIKVESVDPGFGEGNLHEHFLDCVARGAQPPLSHVWAARHVTEVLLGGLEAGRTGRVVEVRSQAEPD